MAIQVRNHNYKFTSLRSCTLRSLPRQRRGRRRNDDRGRCARCHSNAVGGVDVTLTVGGVDTLKELTDGNTS